MRRFKVYFHWLFNIFSRDRHAPCHVVRSSPLIACGEIRVDFCFCEREFLFETFGMEKVGKRKVKR